MAARGGESGDRSEVLRDGVRSEVSGFAGNAVQARDVSGGVHFHHAGPVPVPVPRQLPAAVRDFTGRAADLAVLDALLPTDGSAEGTAPARAGTVVICAIDGMAGIGKTALAVQWAHRVGGRFPDGTLYANLRGYGPGQPAAPQEILGGFLRALDVPRGRVPTDVEEQAALYRSLLDGRRLLLVLDNAATAAQVRPLLPASGGCLVLVTSRSSLPGLVIGQGAARISLDLLAADDALGLLRALIDAPRVEADPRSLGGIAIACGRLPLALRIAGQRIAARPHLRLTDALGELADERDRLEALSTSDDQSTAIRSVFTWSYQALPAEQARLFRHLGLHRGTEISTHATAALTDTAPATARRILDTLAAVHLVEPIAHDRYQTHDLLHTYARERAGDEESDDARHAAIVRLLGFYLHTVDQADRRLLRRRRNSPDAIPVPAHPITFATDRDAHDWYQSEQITLMAAVAHAADAGLHAVAWQLPAALVGFLERYANRADWLATLQIGLAAARMSGDREGETWMLRHLGKAHSYLRQYRQAVTSQHAALNLARQAADLAAEAAALEYLGIAHQGMDQFDEAEACYAKALSIQRRRNDAWAIATVMNHLGEAYQHQQRYGDAIDLHRQALTTFREMCTIGDRNREGWTLRLLADAHLGQGDIDTASDLYGQALPIFRDRGSRREEARALDGLGTTIDHAGDHETAAEYWREALDILDSIADPDAHEIRARLTARPSIP